MIWQYILCASFNGLSRMASAAVARIRARLFGEERMDVGFEDQ